MKQQGISRDAGHNYFSQDKNSLQPGPVIAIATLSVFPGHYRSSDYSLQPHYFFVPSSISLTFSSFPRYNRVISHGKGRLDGWFGDKS
jgi:hypothetical protein